MALQINHTVVSNLTLVLAVGETSLIRLSGVSATTVLSIQILDTSAKCSIKSCVDSPEYTSLEDVTLSDCLWENIQIDGVAYSEISEDVLSVCCVTPNFLYVQNTGTVGRVKISIRSNR